MSTYNRGDRERLRARYLSGAPPARSPTMGSAEYMQYRLARRRAAKQGREAYLEEVESQIQQGVLKIQDDPNGVATWPGAEEEARLLNKAEQQAEVDRQQRDMEAILSKLSEKKAEEQPKRLAAQYSAEVTVEKEHEAKIRKILGE